MKKHLLLTFTSLLTLTCSLNAASRIEKRTEHAKGTQSQQNLVLHNEEHAPESMIASSSSKNEKSNYSIPQDEASVPAAPRTPQPNRAPEPVENQPAAPAPQPVAPTRPGTPPAAVPQRSPQPRPEPEPRKQTHPSTPPASIPQRSPQRAPEPNKNPPPPPTATLPPRSPQPSPEPAQPPANPEPAMPQPQPRRP